MQDVGKTREEFVNYEFFKCSSNIPSGLSASKPSKLVFYCFYIIIQKTRDFSMGLPAQKPDAYYLEASKFSLDRKSVV